MKLLHALSAAPASYRVLLSDVWGVVHDGMQAFPAACQALARWRAERGPVILISNSPRPRDGVIVQLDELGVPRSAWSAVATSGDATRSLLTERAPGPALRIGPERDEPLYAGLGLRFSGLEQARFIVCTGPDDDETETPADYRALFEQAAARDLEMICANPDLVVQRGARLIYCAGALASLYAELGGRVVMAGKPHAPLYDLALEEAARELGRPVMRAEVLALGDALATDIAGANAQGLASVLVADGIHGAELIEDGEVSASAAARLLSAAGLSADFVTARLIW